MPYIIYTDIESLIRKIGRCAGNPENFSTTKIGEHVPCGYSVSLIWTFDHRENKSTFDRGKDCMEKFCESVRGHAKNIINFEKKRCYRYWSKNLNQIKMQKYAIFVENNL